MYLKQLQQGCQFLLSQTQIIFSRTNKCPFYGHGQLWAAFFETNNKRASAGFNVQFSAILAFAEPWTSDCEGLHVFLCQLPSRAEGLSHRRTCIYLRGGLPRTALRCPRVLKIRRCEPHQPSPNVHQSQHLASSGVGAK